MQGRQERDLANQAAQTLDVMWHNLQHGLVRQVADYFTDLVGPIKNLQETTTIVPADETAYQQAADTFLEHSRRVKRTANLAANNLIDPWRGNVLQALASNLESVGSQVSMAGRAVMSARQNGASAQLQNAASDHFDLVKKHWTECAERTRNLVDEAIDAKAFIKAQETGILKETDRIEDSVDQHCLTSVVNGTTSIALRANRVLQVAMRETVNSEDPIYVDRVNEAAQWLRATITPMVADTKKMVLAMDNPDAREHWRVSSRNLVEAVSNVGQVVAPSYLHPFVSTTIPPSYAYHHKVNGLVGSKFGVSDEIPVAEMRQLHVQGGPSCGRSDDNSRPLSPETDIEDEFNYPMPEENQPIMAAAHALHQEARLWSSRDNELIAATKRIAGLMAKLSQVVR
uniref:Vinculin n=1 Tax=Mesocestoides corti TaxID=53468 RepID=A0A5K3FZ65_MESCO